jgi:fructosamine-3-kinase
MNACLPSLTWHQTPGPEIQSVEALGGGDFCTCYVINRTHVLRLAKHARASASLRREMLLLPHLEQYLNVQIPQVSGAGTRIEYCILKLSEGDEEALQEALAALVTQATTYAVV